MFFEQDQTLASTAAPLRGRVGSLAREMFEVNRSWRIENLRPYRFPELKPILCRYPIKLFPDIGDYELNRSSTKKLGKIILTKAPDATFTQRAIFIPKLLER